MSDSLRLHGLYSLPGSSDHGILPARTLEWFTISFSRVSSWRGIEFESNAFAGRFFTTEPPGKSLAYSNHLINATNYHSSNANSVPLSTSTLSSLLSERIQIFVWAYYQLELCFATSLATNFGEWNANWNVLWNFDGSEVKYPLAMQETQEAWVWSLGLEDPLEEDMTTHSSNFAGKSHG